jgi:probable rRNA maturation factor
MSVTTRPRPNRPREVAVAVQYGVQPDHLPTRAQLRRWARAALGSSAAVTLRIVGAREGRALNRKFRGRDYATNVLAFPYDERGRTSGDVAICAPVVEREARAAGVSREAHFAHLTVHGLLHLQGYDHLRVRDARVMERLEVRILGTLGYDNPYAAR